MPPELPDRLAALQSFLSIGAVLFGVGLIGFLSRRNMIVMFLSAEMMLQGVSLSLVAWGRYHNDLGGQMLVVFIIAVAACEAAIALALVLMLFERKRPSRYRHVAGTARVEPAAVRRRTAAAAERRRTRTLAALDPGGRVAGIGRRGRFVSSEGLSQNMESYIPKLLILIPALPLLAAAVVAVLGKRVLREQSHWPVAVALAGSCLASVVLDLCRSSRPRRTTTSIS